MSKKTKVSGSAKEMETAYKASNNRHDQKRLLAQAVWVDRSPTFHTML